MLLVVKGRSGVTTADFGLLKNRPRVRVPRKKEESVVFAACAFVTRQVGPGGGAAVPVQVRAGDRQCRLWRPSPQPWSPFAEITDMKLEKNRESSLIEVNFSLGPTREESLGVHESPGPYCEWVGSFVH